MTTGSNSTFAEVSPLDKMALYVPHWLYSTPANSQLVTFGLMIVIAVTLVVLGSYATVTKPKYALDPIYDRSSPLWDPSDRDGSPLYISLPDAALNLNMDMIDLQSALLFPVLASGALYGLDYLLRRMDIQKIKLLNYYVTAMVIPATYITLNYLFTAFLRNVGYRLGLKHNLQSFFRRYRLTLSSDEKSPLGMYEQFDLAKMKTTKSGLKEFEKWMWDTNRAKLLKLHKVEPKKQHSSLVFDLKFLFVLPAATALLVLFYFHNPVLRDDYYSKKINWIVNNLVAFALSIAGCQVTRLGKFKIGVFMLVGLLAYDIYFVFGSTLMVSVASSLELPVKIVIPTAPAKILSLAEMATKPVAELQGGGASILGLGDIVIPAMFMSLCLRFDYAQFYAHEDVAFHHLRSIGVPRYFATALVGYIGGLVATMAANYYSSHGQPALLYIVPLVLGSVLIQAWARDEILTVWGYSEEIEAYQKPNQELPAQDTSDSEQEESGRPMLITDITYEFEVTDDETDDTYIIEEDTADDEEAFDDEDLSNEINYLLRDQQETPI